MIPGAHMPKGCLNLRVGQAIMEGMHARRTMSQERPMYKAHFFLVKMDGYLEKGRISPQNALKIEVMLLILVSQSFKNVFYSSLSR